MNSGPDPYWKGVFERTGREPIVWLLSAQCLFRSFETLWRVGSEASEVRQTAKAGEPLRDDARPAAMMLAGLALENLAKGILVGRSPKLVEDGKFTKRTHDTTRICDLVHVALDLAERDLLARLQCFVEWAGRYPIATKYEKYMPTQRADGSIAPPAHIYGDDDERIGRLYRRLKNELEKARAK